MTTVPDRQSDARAAALDSFGIMGTSPEVSFDEITSLVAAICEAPLARVSFVYRDKQFFKSAFGEREPETPLDTSICVHAVRAGDPLMEIEDTLLDPRTMDNPSCKGPPHLRFYAGALLTTAEGVPVGTLCVLDHRPRRLTALQRQALTTMAHQIMTALNLRLALRRQVVLQREIDHRVKNSLQSVASFVRLQAARHDDPLAKEALEAVGRRVSTVALLHQELAVETHGDLVALERYMSKVAALFGSSAPPGVHVLATFDPIIVDCMVATATAAIANEFVANSFKHAFPGHRSGEVQLRGERTDDGGYRMYFSDDGVGLANGSPERTGLGTRIIEAAAAQIGGRLEAVANGVGYSLEMLIPMQRLTEFTQKEAASRLIPNIAG